MKIGVLALQGDFERHAHKLSSLGAKILLVRRAEELDALDAIVLPGGESTTLLRLADESFRFKLSDAIARGLPTLATCAGLILVASKVTDPEQPSLSNINVTVARNAYGRQVDSFIAPDMQWSEKGGALLREMDIIKGTQLPSLEGVFIRAPRITELGPGVNVLVEYNRDPVLVLQQNILAATFHPELSESSELLYKIFFKLITLRK